MTRLAFCVAAAAGVAALASNHASAALVFFQNGEGAQRFVWNATRPGVSVGNVFDITKSAADQSTASSVYGFGCSAPAQGGGSQTRQNWTIGGGVDAAIARADGSKAQTFADGSLIGANQLWDRSAVTASRPGANQAVDFSLGFPATLGLRITIAGQTHYGFVNFDGFNGSAYQPAYWGYELTPNTPVRVVPGPTGALMLSLGLMGRRRRREHKLTCQYKTPRRSSR